VTNIKIWKKGEFRGRFGLKGAFCEVVDWQQEGTHKNDTILLFV